MYIVLVDYVYVVEQRKSNMQCRFLWGLNDKYALVRGLILLMDRIPAVNKIFSLFIQQERQHEISIPSYSISPIAFNVQSNNVNCNKKNRNNSTKNRTSPICAHYKKTGHTIEKCYKLHGVPSGYRSNQTYNNNNSSSNYHVNLLLLILSLKSIKKKGRILLISPMNNVSNWLPYW